MRILLSTYGSRGDVEPLAGLGVALQALGAEAVVCAPPDQEFVDVLARAGVPFAPAFSGVRDWIARARRTGMALPELAAIMVAEQYRAIGEAAQGCDAIVATGLMPSAAAAQCVAEKNGLGYRYASFCPLYLPSHHHQPVAYPGHPHPAEMTEPQALWDFNSRAIDALFGGAVNTHRQSIGLPALDNIRERVFTDQPLLASEPVLWPWLATDLCEPAQTGAWILPDERPLPDDLVAFLEAGAPPVYVGFGSIALPTVKEAAAHALGAIGKRGRRAVLGAGWADLAAPDDAEACFVIGEVNQQALFGRVAAVVHHGGAGTTTTAALAGAPQLIVPQIVDQPYWAGRVAALGIGAAHQGSAPTMESMTAALDTALAPETGARARSVAATIRRDGAMLAAKLLLGRSG